MRVVTNSYVTYLIRYSIKSKDRIFVKGHEYFSFAKDIGKNISKNKKT